MVVKLNNGAVREIKKAEPIVEKRFTFNGDTLRMVAKANSSKEDITGILFKLKDGRDDDISVFAVNEDAVLVGNLQYSDCLLYTSNKRCRQDNCTSAWKDS